MMKYVLAFLFAVTHSSAAFADADWLKYASVGGLFGCCKAPSGEAPTPLTGWQFARLKNGGNGYVNGINIANDGNKVAWTDISNGYYRTADGAAWRACITRGSMGMDLNNAYGVWGMAIAPSDSNYVYMLYKNAEGGTNNTYLWKSTDQCRHWTKIDDFPGFTADPVIAVGAQRLAVDPANPNVVYAGSPGHGVYRIVGTSVTVISEIAIASAAGSGYAGIAFDPLEGTTTLGDQTVTKRIYIPSGGHGVYTTGDGNNTAFVAISGPGPGIYQEVSTGGDDRVIMIVTSSVSDAAVASIYNEAGLVFQKRGDTVYGQSSWGATYGMEVWWAYAPSQLTDETIGVSFTVDTATAFPNVMIFSIEGADVSGLTPFAEGSVPAFSNHSAPAPTGASTTTNALMFTVQVVTTFDENYNYPFTEAVPPTGWSCVSCIGWAYIAEKAFTSASGSQNPVAGGNTNPWVPVSYLDGVKAASAGSASIDVANYVSSGTESTLPGATGPTKVWRGQVSCDGTYLVTEGNGNRAVSNSWRWHDGEWATTAYTGGTKPMALWPVTDPSSSDCGRVMVVAGARVNYIGQSTDHAATYTTSDYRNSLDVTKGIGVTSSDMPVYDVSGSNPYALDMGGGQWNPHTGEWEFTTGFCSFRGVLPSDTYSNWDWTATCEGMHSQVPYAMWSVPGKDNWFGNVDVSMFKNLNTTEYPQASYPMGLYPYVLSACADLVYTKDHSTLFVLCQQGLGVDSSSVSLDGGDTWKVFGQVLSGPYAPGAADLRQIPEGGSLVGSLAVDPCNGNNLMWAQNGSASFGDGAGIGRLWRTKNAAVVGAAFDASVSGSTMTVSNVIGTIAVGQGIYNADLFGANKSGIVYIVSGAGDTWVISDGSGLWSGTKTTHSGIRWEAMEGSIFDTATPTSAPYGWSAGNYFNRRHTLIADGDSCGTFYVYNTVTGRYYKTEDSGDEWVTVYIGNPVLEDSGYAKFISVPGVAGLIYGTSGYFATTSGRLRRSEDGGASWTTCGGNAWGGNISMGKAPPSGGDGRPTLWMVGSANGYAYGLYYSINSCDDWTFIAPVTTVEGGVAGQDGWGQAANTVGGDMNVWGRVYLGMEQGSGWACMYLVESGATCN